MKKIQSLKEKFEKMEATYTREKNELEEQRERAEELLTKSEEQKKQATTLEELRSINSAIEEANFIITAANNKLNIITTRRMEEAVKFQEEARIIFEEIREKEKPLITKQVLDLVSYVNRIDENLEILRDIQHKAGVIHRRNVILRSGLNMIALCNNPLPSISPGKKFTSDWLKAFVNMWTTETTKEKTINSQTKYHGVEW